MRPIEMHLSDPVRWPLPPYDAEDQPIFFFIVTPPYSGSTAMAKLLNTGERTDFLQKEAEGQWLVPGLCESDRWRQNKPVNYESVKAVWLNRFQENSGKSGQRPDVIIEKSPPNMMRLRALSEQFNSVAYLATNRNPFANCASILRRQHADTALDPKRRAKLLENLAENWLTRSRQIKAILDLLDCPFISYEEFCKNPWTILSKLELPAHVIEQIDCAATIEVKDYWPQKISNQNARQIAQLDSLDLQVIFDVLQTDQELVRFFGYDLVNPAH